MAECIVCLEEFEKIPLLKCSHFVCPTCYCSLKIGESIIAYIVRKK